MPSTEQSMPAAIDSEKSILGAILLDNAAYDQTLGLTPDDFSLDGHRRIFSAMRELREQSHPVDIITLCDRLRATKDFDATGGQAYISQLTDGIPRRPAIGNYVKIVRDKAAARAVIHSCNDAIARAYDQADPIQQVITETEARFFDITGGRIEKDFAGAKEIVLETYGGIEGYFRRGENSQGMPTGFTGLNDLIKGLRAKELIIVAARPSMGKTAFATQLAIRCALKQQKPVAFFSLEMSRESLLDRMVSALASVSYPDLTGGFLAGQDRDRAQHSLDRLLNAPLKIDDTAGCSIGNMRAKARKLARVMGDLGLIVVDYLQLMGATGKKYENRQQEVTAISRGLKILAGEQRCPVVAVSQLSRASEQRGEGAEPRLSDLRESGAIEQDADIVIFPHRPEYYDRDNPELKGKAKLIVAKQRNGPTGAAELGWQHEYARFVNLEQERA